MGRCGRGHDRPGTGARVRADRVVRHGRAAPPDSRRGKRLAAPRRVRPDRAPAVRRRGHRRAERQASRRGVAGGAGARARGGEARPLHHQHGVRRFRHSGGRVGRRPDQGDLPGAPRGGRPGRLRSRGPHAEAGPPARVHHQSGVPDPRACQPHRGRLLNRGRGHRPASLAPRSHRGRLPAHEGDGRPPDCSQAAVGRGAVAALSAHALPGRGDDLAGDASLPARPAAAGGCAPAGDRHLGGRRGERVARVRSRAGARRESTSAARAAMGRQTSGAPSPRGSPRRWPPSCRPRANCGTRGTAPG